MREFAEAAERVSATTKKLEKVAIVADYLKSCPREEAAGAAVFLSGRPFPAWEEATLQVGGRLLWRVVEELSGKSSQELTAAYRKHGDLGAAAAEVLSKGLWGRVPPPVQTEQGSAVQEETTVKTCPMNLS
jgi:DNA ligase-1